MSKHSELLQLTEVGASCFRHYCFANTIVLQSLTQCLQAFGSGYSIPTSTNDVSFLPWIFYAQKELGFRIFVSLCNLIYPVFNVQSLYQLQHKFKKSQRRVLRNSSPTYVRKKTTLTIMSEPSQLQISKFILLELYFSFYR